MKQHITTEQMIELSGTGRRNLKEWFWTKRIEPGLLTIGQMIEFLEEQGVWNGNPVVAGEISGISSGKDWVALAWGGEGVELCDALWSVTKEVLEHDK